MNQSLLEIRQNVFQTFRKATLFMFAFIAVYAPITILMKPREEWKLDPSISAIIVFSLLICVLVFLYQNSS